MSSSRLDSWPWFEENGLGQPWDVGGLLPNTCSILAEKVFQNLLPHIFILSFHGAENPKQYKDQGKHYILIHDVLLTFVSILLLQLGSAHRSSRFG